LSQAFPDAGETTIEQLILGREVGKKQRETFDQRRVYEPHSVYRVKVPTGGAGSASAAQGSADPVGAAPAGAVADDADRDEKVADAIVRAALPSLDGSHVPELLKSEDLIDQNALAWRQLLDQGLAAQMSFQDEQWAKYVTDVTEEWTDEEYCTVYEQALNVYGHTSLSTLSTEEARWLRDPEAVGAPAGYTDETRARFRRDGKQYHYCPKPPQVPDFFDGSCHLTCLGDSGFSLYGERRENGKRTIHPLSNCIWETVFWGRSTAVAMPALD